jgi:hypothetical protein
MPELADISAALVELRQVLNIHFATSEERDRKVDEMYRVLVVGNGVPSIKDRVRHLENSIIERDTITAIKNELDVVSHNLPSREEWLEVRAWVWWSKWIAGIIVAATIAQAVALYFKILTQ